MPGRRIQIDYDGEILDMDWDRPEPPTQKDVKDWVQRRRSITPHAPPPGTDELPELPDEYKFLQLPVQAPRQAPDTGFLGAIGEGVFGLGHFAKNIVKASHFNPNLASQSQAQTELRKGFTEPFMQGGREAYQYEQQGDYLKSLGRTLATIPEATLGIPVTGMARDIGEGRYGHAAGSGLFAGALAYLGAKGGKKTLPAGEAALPDVPPPVRPPGPPTQMPLQYGFDQPNLPFREPAPAPTTIHGPEIGPYGVPDPNIQQPLGFLQPVIGKQRLGFDVEPTQPWFAGPEVGAFPKGKPKVSGVPTPEGGVTPSNKFVTEPKPPVGPQVGKFKGEATEGPVARAATSNIPELQDAAKKTTMWERGKAKVQGSAIGRAAADIAKSGTSVIKSSGKTGPELARVLSRTRLVGEYLGGDWTTRAKEATKGLTPEQVKIYVESRDKGIVPNDPAVQQALQKRAALDAEVVKATKDSGAGIRTAEGKIIPFRERTNYWPHIYEKGKFKDPNTVNELIAEGWSPEDAAQAVQNAGRYGERLISAQHERQGNAPGYRMDLNADYLHLNDLGKRVAEARELGPLDIADESSPVSQLIKGTAEPNRIREVVSRHLGRDMPETGTAAWGEVNQGIRKATTAAHLSHFALSNMSQLASVPLRSNLGAYTKALTKTITDWKKSVGEAEATGALQTIHQDLLREAGGESWVSKAYGLKQSETLNRSVAAISGKGTAESLFRQLKKDPTNKRARARLEDLILEPSDNVLKQDALTPEQLGISGGRMSEITQGRAQLIDLPRKWTGEPAVELALIFKKYAFQQGRIIKAAIQENPGRNIPLFLATYAAMGEGLGDVKAGIKGSVSGQGAGEAIAERGEGLERMINNMSQAWAFGMLGDVVEFMQRGPGGLAEFTLGPVVSDVGKAGYNIARGSGKGLAKQAAQAIPFVGSGIAAQVGGGSDKVGLPRPPRASSSLPRVPRP